MPLMSEPLEAAVGEAFGTVVGLVSFTWILSGGTDSA